MIYFDHNATTATDERVVEAMQPYLTTFYGNPSSLYKLGRIAQSAIATAREQVSALVGAKPAQVVFTSGGTEANNLALKLLEINSSIAISAIEHPSIAEVAHQWQNRYIIPVDSNGLITLSTVKTLYHKRTSPRLISIMMANNETGAIQNIEETTRLFQSEHILIHTDAVQAAGKIPISWSQLKVDLMSLSSHKIYGPKGCGALVIDKKINVTPQLIGGGQENGWRAGTENVAAIVGFGKAAEIALLELEARAEHCYRLRLLLERELKAIPNITIFSEQVERLPNTVQFGIAGIDGEMLLMQLDQKNIAVSSGSACSSGGGGASRVLIAMGIDSSLAKSAIRISLGKSNTIAEINQFITVLKSIVI